MSTDQPREGMGEHGWDEAQQQDAAQQRDGSQAWDGAQESVTSPVPRVEQPTSAMPQSAPHHQPESSGWDSLSGQSEGFAHDSGFADDSGFAQGPGYAQTDGQGFERYDGQGQGHVPAYGQDSFSSGPQAAYPAGSQYGPAHSGPGMPAAHGASAAQAPSAAQGGPGEPQGFGGGSFGGPGGPGHSGFGPHGSQGPQGPYGGQPGTAPGGERKRSFGLPALVATALAASLIGGGIAGGIAASQHSSSSSSSGQQSGGKITIENGQKASAASAVAAKASPSVVTVGAIRGQDGGSGSGIVMDKEGHIMTNAHVVTVNGRTDNVNLQVRLWDNRVYNAKLVGADPLADIAVIKVDGAPNLTPATFGDSGSINVGDMAVVIGSPLGLSGTVTDGIISTKSRTIGLTNSQSTSEDSSNPNDKVYVNVIQTDAALNHGNSGGALVDGKGEVIGVNVAILSGSRSSSGSDSGNSGLGFAIPINAAKRVAESLMKDGKASHGFLGVQVKSQPPAGVSGESIFSAGAVINQVESGSPAEKAGLRKGDVITSVDSMVVEDAKSLTAAVRTFASGQQAKFKVNRDGKEQEITVTLGSLPNS